MSDSQPLPEPTSRALRGPRGYAFPNRPVLPWSHADARLAGARYYWLCTVRPDGRPHTTPLWGSWIQQRLYLDGPPTTVWARNFGANPQVTVHLEDGADVVVLDGIAHDVTTDAGLGGLIVADWMSKYGRLPPDPAGDGIWRITPHAVRAWTTEMLADGTGWAFPETT